MYGSKFVVVIWSNGWVSGCHVLSSSYITMVVVLLRRRHLLVGGVFPIPVSTSHRKRYFSPLLTESERVDVTKRGSKRRRVRDLGYSSVSPSLTPISSNILVDSVSRLFFIRLLFQLCRSTFSGRVSLSFSPFEGKN